MGGEGSVDFSKEDYFALFGFDKAKMLKAKDKKIKQQAQDLNELAERVAALEHKLDYMCNSASWKITKPIRAIKKLFRKWNW